MDIQLAIFGEPIEIGQKRPIEKYCPQQGEIPDIIKIRILDELYRILYYTLKPLTSERKRKKYIFYHDELQAEIDGTQNLSIRDKIHIHIKAIKELRSGRN